MTQIVVEYVLNKKHGGFGLSKQAMERFLTLKGIEYEHSTDKYNKDVFTNTQTKKQIRDLDIERNDPILIQVVRELGEKSNDEYSKLTICTTYIYINDNDGFEMTYCD